MNGGCTLMTVFVNTAELKRDTNMILRNIAKEPAVITRRGHPCAALISIKESELDGLLWEIFPKARMKIKHGLKEMKEGEGISMREFAKKYGLV